MLIFEDLVKLERRDVQLVLPETGVCSTDLDEPACCGTAQATPAPDELPLLVGVGSGPSEPRCCG